LDGFLEFGETIGKRRTSTEFAKSTSGRCQSSRWNKRITQTIKVKGKGKNSSLGKQRVKKQIGHFGNLADNAREGKFLMKGFPNRNNISETFM
jgi:hypothetical protein